jgi:hypothetical protein
MCEVSISYLQLTDLNSSKILLLFKISTSGVTLSLAIDEVLPKTGIFGVIP